MNATVAHAGDVGGISVNLVTRFAINLEKSRIFCIGHIISYHLSNTVMS